MNEEAAGGGTPPIKMEIFQEKAASFRVVHADGAWMSINPYRNLHVTFYSERSPIPKSVTLSFDETHGWKELPSERVVKKGWFREMEVDVVLNLEAVRALQNSLVHWLAELERQQADYDKSLEQS
jgi:hypothetical protein